MSTLARISRGEIREGERCARTAARPAVPYLRYLEGLRGLAALDVTLYHIWGHTLNSMTLAGRGAVLRDWVGALLYGRAAVDVFIVLSGYLLMRPAARSPDGRLPNGIGGYLQRRAWRILPPDYAALFFALILEVAIPALRTPLSVQWNDSLPPFGVKNIVAHLLLLHNLSWHWAAKIDSPMWTVATEWQIYFVFPSLLLPVWRKLGSFASMAVGLFVGLGCYFTVGGHSAAPWFIGLFAFGMAAAARDQAGGSPERDRRVFGWVTVCLVGLYAWLMVSFELNVYRPDGLARLQAMWDADWPMDILVGAATAALLAYASAAARGSPSGLIRLLSMRWCVWLGVISYSLYLIHDPLLAIFKILLIHLHYGPLTQFVLMIVVALPVVMVITYGFHLLFEKPFMSARRVRGAESRGKEEVLSAARLGSPTSSC